MINVLLFFTRLIINKLVDFLFFISIIFNFYYFFTNMSYSYIVSNIKLVAFQPKIIFEEKKNLTKLNILK